MNTKKTTQPEGTATITSIIPLLGEKPRILIKAKDGNDELATSYYFHTPECAEISREQLSRIFKTPPMVVVQKPEDYEGIEVKYKLTLKNGYKNINFYPVSNALEAEEASIFA